MTQLLLYCTVKPLQSTLQRILMNNLNMIHSRIGNDGLMLKLVHLLQNELLPSSVSVINIYRNGFHYRGSNLKHDMKPLNSLIL